MAKIVEPRLKDLPREVELSEEMEEAIPLVGESINLFAREQLGVDISSRLPRRSDIHVLSRGDFTAYYAKKYPKHKDTADRTWGFSHKGQIVVAEDSPSSFVHALTHEEMHVVAGDRWRLRVSNDSGAFGLTQPRHGLRVRVHSGGTPTQKNSFYAIDEYITERSTREVISDYWPRVGINLQLSDDEYGYNELIPRLDGAIRLAATKQRVSMRELTHDIERGALTSDMKVLRPFLMVLDHSMAYELTHLRPYGQNTHDVNQKLGRVAIPTDQ